MASSTSSILLIGAGELGTAVLEALAKHPRRNGGKISILLRPSTITTQDKEKRRQNEHLRSLGAEFEAGDTVNDDVPRLAAIFRRFHTVISCSGFGLPPGTQLKLSTAVLEAGTPRYLPWQWGIDYEAVGGGSAQDLFDEQLQVRAALRRQRRTDWVVVSTGLFMSFLLEPAFGVVDLRARTLRALGAWDARLTMTSARDIGRVAADVVYDPRDDVARHVVYVAGDTVTYARVAELVQRRFGGGGWTRELWGEEDLRRRLEERLDDGMLKYAHVWAVGRGVAWDVQSTLNARRGIEMQGLEGYLRNMPDL
ncbi:NAD(P)-binding protein [Hypoxylon sp. NC1633]|nr:NAD(P)-binding protein [Hypoxylon sp. NC1633]